MLILYVAMKYDYGRPEQGLSFEHFNFFDPLHRMGHDVLYFDVMSLLQTRGREAMNRRLAEVAAAQKPDLLFACVSNDELDKSVVRTISDAGQTITLNWFTDDHWRFDGFSRFWAPNFNWVITTARSALPKYEEMGYSNVIKSQWACNHFQYRRLNLPMKYDATFVGQPHGDRRYMVRALREAGIDVRCWGTGWESGRLTQEQMIEVFNQSRINLNFSNASTIGPVAPLKRKVAGIIARAADYIPGGRTLKVIRKRRMIERQSSAAALSLQPQIKGRNFEVPGCGGLIVSGEAEDLDHYYEPGSEIICFGNAADLIEKCRSLLSDEDRRRRVAATGYERTLRDHTYVQRFSEVFQRIGLPHHTGDESLSGKAVRGEVHEVN